MSILSILNLDWLKEFSYIFIEFFLTSILNNDFILTSKIIIETLKKNNKVLRTGFDECLLENENYLEQIYKYKNIIQSYKLKTKDYINVLHYLFQASKFQRVWGKTALFKFIKKLIEMFDLTSIEKSYLYDLSKENLIRFYFDDDILELFINVNNLEITEILEFIRKEKKRMKNKMHFY